jgi:secondary thiamine-phosphate synthase enzyme
MENRISRFYKTEKQFINLNADLQEFVKDRKGTGLIHVFVRHATCGIKILENEILLLADINQHLEQLAPADKKYLHDHIEIRDVPVNERINGFSHIRQLYFSTSETIPVENGQLLLGKWQTVFLVELDPIRDREVIFTYIEVK